MIITELFRLFGSIMVNDSAARASLHNIDSQASNSSRSLGAVGKAGASMGSLIMKYAAMATGALATMGGAIAGIKYDAQLEQSNVAWKTLLGTQEKATDMLQRIGKFAKATPFETENVDMMAKYMHNAGLAGNDLFDALMKVSDVSSAFAIPAAEAQELTRQMSQVRQAGVAYTEDLNVLQDRGVPIYKAIADQLGINVAAVKKLASDGKLSSDIYIKAFDNIANSVKGASDEQSKTFNGMLSTLSDNLKMISGQLLKGVFEKFKGTLEALMPILDRFSATLKDEGLKAALSELFGEDKVNAAINLFNTIRDIGVTAFNLLKDTIKFVSDNINTLIPIFSGLTAAIVAQLIINVLTKAYRAWQLATEAQTTAQWLLNVAMDANPIGIVALAIGALIAIGVALYRNWDTVREKTRQLWDKLGAFQAVAAGVLGPIGFIIRAAVTMAENWDSTKSIWENIWNGIAIAASNSVNEVITLINKMIKAINKIPGVNIPIIAKVDWGEAKPPKSANKWTGTSNKFGAQKYAKGTNFAPGGMALVGEHGPELISNLPRGAKVSTAGETSKMMGSTFNFDGFMNGAVFNVREEADVKKVAKEVYNMTRQSARGKGVVMA